MTIEQLTTLLLGSVGCLVLSLLLNYAFYKGWVLNPKRTVLKEDYDVQRDINKRNTTTLEYLAERSKKAAEK